MKVAEKALTKLKLFREHLIKNESLDPNVTLSDVLDFLLWKALQIRIKEVD